MIKIDENAPRWIRELERFIHIKSLLLVHGHILDLVSYPILQKKSGNKTNVYWAESDLPIFFQRFLTGLGYDIVGLVDPVEGLQFTSEEMEDQFSQIAKGKQYTEPKSRTVPPKKTFTTNTGKVRSKSNKIGRDGLVDLAPIVNDISSVVQNREVPSAFVFHLSSRLIDSPDHLSQKERVMFTRMLKASLEAKEVIRDEQRWSNVIILVCDKINDLPVFLYLNNSRSRSIYLDNPNQQERIRFFQSIFRSFYEAGETPSSELSANFGAFTEGFSYYEMMSLVGLSRREQIPVQNLQNLCERFKYGITESAWDKIDKTRLEQSSQFLYQRIKGQDHAVERVLTIIKRAKLGLAAGSAKMNQRPRGVLFFAGPTGVGKTEMAKGLAALLFGQEDRLVRFDMSEYASPHADQKLLGSPPGYVGYEEGGQLTNAIKQNPFSVLLFDEIEKAHPSIFDKFLQILDDGRLTDGKGETTYFSECIIIFTSNLGTVSKTDEGKEVLVTPELAFTQVRNTILSSIRDHFNFTLGRPEILNRFGDNFIVFDFIRPPADEYIVALLLKQLQRNLFEEHRIELNIDSTAVETWVQLARANLAFGGRGIRNVIDATLVNPLAAWLFDHNISSDAKLTIQRCIDHGEGKVQRIELIIDESRNAFDTI